tara:strand:+ start:864 stop:1133 length:270 start_codon:yes stop_codon:yes gene_type:complete
MINMSWEKIVKKDIDEWLSIKEVLTGEFSFERWKDTAVPPELKQMKTDYDSLGKDVQSNIIELFRVGEHESNQHRMALFKLIVELLKVG